MVAIPDAALVPLAIIGIAAVALHLLYQLVNLGLSLWSANGCPAMHVAGKRVLVTGGSTGIGLETAKSFAVAGARVVIAARREDVLVAAAKEVDAATLLVSGTTAVFPCRYVVMDVSDDAAVAKGLAEAARHFEGAPQNSSSSSSRSEPSSGGLKRRGSDGGMAKSAATRGIATTPPEPTIDVLVCCAGFSYPSRFLNCPTAEARRLMDVNYHGCTAVVRGVLPQLLEHHERVPAAAPSRIVLVSSMAALAPVAGFTHYAPTKAALLAFGHSLDMEVASRGVRVQVVVPPDVQTPGYDDENKIKSEECRRICAMGGASPFSSADMGSAIFGAVSGGGDFLVTLGFDGALLGHLSAMMQPRSALSNFLEAGGVMSLARLLSSAYIRLHYGIVGAVVKEERAANKKRGKN